MRITAKQLAALGRGQAARIPQPLESEIQRSVVQFLRRRGAVVIRANSGLLPRADGGRMRSTHSAAGAVSDLIACYRGRFLGFEVNRPGKKPTEAQAAFLEAVRFAGRIAAVVSSIDDAAAILDGIDALPEVCG